MSSGLFQDNCHDYELIGRDIGGNTRSEWLNVLHAPDPNTITARGKSASELIDSEVDHESGDAVYSASYIAGVGDDVGGKYAAMTRQGYNLCRWLSGRLSMTASKVIHRRIYPNQAPACAK